MTTTGASVSSQQQHHSYDVIIVGGGIAGMATAVALLSSSGSPSSSNDYLKVAVLERATSLQPVGAALGLFPNGLRALQAISPTIHDKVLASCIPSTLMVVKDAADPSKILQTMDRRSTPGVQKDASDKDTTEDDSEAPKETQQAPKEKEKTPTTRGGGGGGGGGAVGGVHMIVWYLLQQYLREELPPCNVVHLGTSVESVEMVDNNDNESDNNPHSIKVTALNRSSGQHETFSCNLLIGADGIHSTLRQQLWPATCSKLHYRHKVMFRAVMKCDAIDSEYCPPRGEQVGYKGQVAGKLFAFRETSPGLLTFTSMATFDDVPEEFCGPTTTAADRKAHLQELFADYPAQVLHILERCPADAIYVNAIYDLDHVVDEWSLSEHSNVIIIGDAAHAMTPGMGQGANMGLEDAAELAHFLLPMLENDDKQDKDTMQSVLQRFWKSRIERVKMVHEGSRRMTLANNQADATKDKKKEMFQQDPKLREKVHGWVPSKLLSKQEPEEEATV